MRRFDKLKTIRKANLLTEERYLESKGLLNENEANDGVNKIETLVGGLVDSPDFLNPKQISNKYSIKKENGVIILIDNVENSVMSIDDFKRLKRILINDYFNENKGKNINLKNYSTEKIKGNELKIGDVYARDIAGSRYIYKVLDNFKPSHHNPNFFNLSVETLDVGNSPKRVENNPDGTYEIIGKNIGDKTIDTFKNMFGVNVSNKIQFGDVIRVLNF